MRQKFQLCFAFVVLLTLLLGQGCQFAPVFVLWNSSPSDVTFKWDDKKNVTLKCGSKHRLPNHPTEISGREFDSVIFWKEQQLGYVIDFENLVKSETVHRHRYDFQLEDDGKIYLVNPKGYKYGILTNQPQGFPLEPVLISKAE